MSLTHIHAAAFFARHCFDIERQAVTWDASLKSDRLLDHAAYVLGAITSSAAFLEATINEVYEARYRGAPDAGAVLPHITSHLMAVTWKYVVEGRSSLSTLDKYQLAIELAGRDKFAEASDKTPPPVGSFPDVRFLMELRNALIHYQPVWEWPDDAHAPTSVRRLRANLKARFSKTPNPVVPYPMHMLKMYLGHSCAEWAVHTSLSFTDDFFSRIGMLNRTDFIRATLKTQ